MRFSHTVACALLALTLVAPLHAQALTAISPAPAPTAISPAKEKAIRQLLVVTGTSDLMQQQMDRELTSLQTSLPNVPAAAWAKLRTRMKAESLVPLLIPVYDKYYTQQDLDGLIAFYQTPLGKKLVAVSPQVSRESMTIGELWGRKQAVAVMMELQQEKGSPKGASGT